MPVGRTLSDLFSRPLLRKVEAAYLPYQVRDHLAMLGSWSAVDWQHAAQFAEYAADRTSLNRLLSADDVASLETRQRMRDLLGVAEREFHAAHGWEWVLEASLRRAGFFETGARKLPSDVEVPFGSSDDLGRDAGLWECSSWVIAVRSRVIPCA